MRRSAGLLSLVLLVGVLPLGGPRPVDATDPSSDIPGIPLPGPLASGTLGGPIYDVVYRVGVPPGHVMVAALSGSPGTDFDLYLFDQSATTVVANVGVVAKSTGPTSTESLSYASLPGGTYYLDLNGATDVEGPYVLTVQIVPDPSPPIVSTLLLDGGRVATANPTVDVLVVATDDLSGVTHIALSGDGTAFGPWVPYTGHATWDLPPGDGPKRVWVRAMNGVGLVSEPASASIVLDTVGPAVVTLSPPRDSVTTSLRPVISVTFSEPIDPGTWSAFGLVVQAPTGTVIPGSTSYVGPTRTGTFQPVVDLTPGLLYLVTVGGVRDLAGNAAIPTGSWWLKPMLATRVTVRSSATTVIYGTTVTLSGTLAPPPLAGASLQSRPAIAQEFSAVTDLSSSGTFTIAQAPTMTTRYRVDYPGSVSALPARSAELKVSVRWSAILAGPGPATIRTGRAGVPITIQVRVRPLVPGASVSFRSYRYDPVRRAYVYAGSRGARVTTAGTAAISWTPAAGRWRWMALVSGTAALATGSSATYSWAISR